MLFIVFVILAMPVVLPFFFVWAYSRALLAGIASARDEHHRMTPSDPWFFFDRAFNRRRTTILAISSIGLAVEALFWGTVARPTALDQILAHLIITLGTAALAAAVAALGAPRSGGPLKLAVLATIAGVSLFPASLICVVSSVAPGSLNWFYGFGFAGIASWPLAWLYVRRRMCLAWFRFPE